MKEAQSVYELFEEADTDRSGTISKEEFINFEASIGVTSEAEALELFAQVDSDKNGEKENNSSFPCNPTRPHQHIDATSMAVGERAPG